MAYRGEREVIGLALDRQSIERKDFSIVKRGYDPGAVAARLSAIADEVEGLQRGSQRPQPDTLAGAVSEQVRGIVEAAENSAAEILRGAELEAQEIRAQASQAAEEATGEVQRRREQAASHAREHVARISDSISQLLGRLEAIDGELDALTASLRTDTERLRGELRSLDTEFQGGPEPAAVSPTAFAPPARAAVPPTAFAPPARAAADVAEPLPAPATVPEPSVGVPPEPVAEPSPGSEKIGDEPPEAAPAYRAQPPHASAADASDDSEGARLIALNMALNGTPREETARYLAENYHLSDQERLLDEVYASVQG